MSPPFSQYAKLILKVSHNYGANLNVCLMAVKAGSAHCNDGFPVMKKFFEKVGVDVDQVALADGRGGNPADRFTPKAATDLLRYWLGQPQAETFRQMLPELGVNGSLAADCKDCPARGKVFAKTRTVGLPDFVNGRLIEAESLGGYREAEPGRFHVFYLVVNGAGHRRCPPNIQRSVRHRRHPARRRLAAKRCLARRRTVSTYGAGRGEEKL